MGLQELGLPNDAGANSRRTTIHPPVPSGSAKACMGEGSSSTTPARHRRPQRTTSRGKSRQERSKAQESNALSSNRTHLTAARESSQKPAMLSLPSPQPKQVAINREEDNREGQRTWDQGSVIVEEARVGDKQEQQVVVVQEPRAEDSL